MALKAHESKFNTRQAKLHNFAGNTGCNITEIRAIMILKKHTVLKPGSRESQSEHCSSLMLFRACYLIHSPFHVQKCWFFLIL